MYEVTALREETLTIDTGEGTTLYLGVDKAGEISAQLITLIQRLKGAGRNWPATVHFAGKAEWVGTCSFWRIFGSVFEEIEAPSKTAFLEACRITAEQKRLMKRIHEILDRFFQPPLLLPTQ